MVNRRRVYISLIPLFIRRERRPHTKVKDPDRTRGHLAKNTHRTSETEPENAKFLTNHPEDTSGVVLKKKWWSYIFQK